MDYKNYFNKKKITLMGLGLLGRGVGDAKFLAECGADIIVTDIKKAEELKSSLDELAGFKNIKFVLGEHRLEDFRDRDMILKSAGVPIDSPYIIEARKNNIPIEMSASLFVRLSGVKIVGVTGTRGKTTVTNLIFSILKESGFYKKVFLGGNIKGVSTLSFLKDVQSSDIAVLELDSWQLQGFGESGISPNISVFTTFMPDHMNYYKNDLDAYLNDKAQIFLYQKHDDKLILGDTIAETVQQKYGSKIKSTIVVAGRGLLPKDWEIKLPGEYNKYNISIAIATGLAMNINIDLIKKVVENFSPIEGRLEYKMTIKGVKVYNDTTATTPDATVVALKSLANLEKGEKVVLIMGGADKQLDMNELIAILPVYAKSVILLPGTGTSRIKSQICSCNIDLGVKEAEDLQHAIKIAFADTKPGDVLLFSPAFASFGMFKNEYDRGDRFNEIISKMN